MLNLNNPIKCVKIVNEMKKLKNMEISLPVNSNNNIDYTYISTFIKAQEKLSIKNIIIFKKRIRI